MQNIHVMKLLQTCCNVNKCLPYDLFIERSMIFLMLDDFLIQISVIAKFHYYASSNKCNTIVS